MDFGWITFWALFPVIFSLVRMYLPIYYPAIGPFGVPVGGILTALVAMFLWKVPFLQVIAAALQGIVFSIEILFLFFATGFLLQVIRQSGVSQVIGPQLAKIHPDRRVQMVLIAWLIGGLLQSVLGFSATGAVCVLMMTAAGFPPACAVIMGVIGPMTASSFSLMGAPITVGLRRGFEDPALIQQVLDHGMNMDQYLQLVSSYVGMIQGIVGIFMPWVMCAVMVRFFGENRSWKETQGTRTFCILCGLLFSVPFALTAHVWGPEFPCVVGGVVGIVGYLILVNLRLATPREAWQFPDASKWENNWSSDEKLEPPPAMPMWKALVPFILLFGFYLASRIPSVGLGEWLKQFDWRWEQVWGTAVTIQFQTLYSPAVFFVLLGIVCTVFYWLPRTKRRKLFKSHTVAASFLMIFYVPQDMIMACIYLNTSVNGSGLPSMATVAANFMVSLPFSEYWGTFFLPLLGAASTFYTGNIIFGNMVLAPFQSSFGESLVGSGALFVAMHAIGSASCNLFSIYAITGCTEVVGMLGNEATIERKTVPVMLFYILAVGIVGLVAVQLLF